jgi:hypothetical protein
VTLKVIGSGEIVQHVYWLDLRARTCGVKLWHPDTGHERCSERPVADFLAAGAGGKMTRASVENILGERAQEILRDE